MKKILLVAILLTASLTFLTSCAMSMVGTPQGTTDNSGSDVWYASCSSGHGEWNGPKRSTRQEAEMDATAHDQANHGGTQTAIIQHITQTPAPAHMF